MDKKRQRKRERDAWWKKTEVYYSRHLHSKSIVSLWALASSFIQSFIHSFIQNCSSIMKSKSKFKLINILSTFEERPKQWRFICKIAFERPSAWYPSANYLDKSRIFCLIYEFFSHFVCNSMCMLLEQLISIQNAIVNKLKLYGYGNLHFHRSITLFFDTYTLVVDNLLVSVGECANGSRG